MKNYIIAIFCIVSISQLRADEKVMGAATYVNKTFKVPLIIMGPLTGTKLTAPTISVYGPADFADSIIGTGVIRGPLNSQNTDFSGKITVHGNVQATHTKFKSSLIVYGDQEAEILLEDADTKDITVQSEQSGSSQGSSSTVTSSGQTGKKKTSWPQVRIKGNSHVKGDIIFIGIEGSVTLDETARHTGIISGARKESPIVKKDEPFEGVSI